ncbi:MAG TPA: methyltransferase domain-containing protein, partial [Vicinamibacterales bacterium]|nr:methyltransferase domain-containing protein [Vicinamibacterales bacterium]
MAKSSPHDNLAGFFDMRARQVNRSPSREELCFASGRDPRLWTDEALYQDMIDSICTQAGITADSRVLEVGCAAGYLAAGIAARCRSYVGVDFAPAAVARARSLALSNARFESADATALPMADGS